jgi:hypothetical protein
MKRRKRTEEENRKKKKTKLTPAGRTLKDAAHIVV